MILATRSQILEIRVRLGVFVLGRENFRQSLVHGRRGISPEMAIRLDLAFGGGADTCLPMQATDMISPKQSSPERRGQNQGETLRLRR